MGKSISKTVRPDLDPTPKLINPECVPRLSYANQNFIPWNLKCETDRN